MQLIRILTPLALVGALAACNSPGTVDPKVQAAVNKACQTDATVQPVAAAAVSAAVTVVAPVAPGPAAATVGAVAVDNAVVHPAVQAACDAEAKATAAQ